VLENTSLTECDDDAENVVEDIKVKAPLEGAAHFNPVAVALSATILAMGIVPGTIANDSAL
jgi:hypothetical protein